jgi:hypothetical protein
VKTTPATIEKNQELTSTEPESRSLPSAKRRAAIAWVPTDIALREPPNIQSRISDGKSAAWAFDDSGCGSQEKNTMSISLTTLWVSIAKTVGVARRSTTAYGEPLVTTFALFSSSVDVTFTGKPRRLL